jgi:hypothetical protein
LGIALAALLAATLALQVQLLATRDGMFYAGGDVAVGGDFIVFYAAGRIADAGNGPALYDPARQMAEQRAILGRERGLAIFPYPAFVAAPYALLSRLTLPFAFVVATALMVVATIGAILLLRRVSPSVRAHPWLAFLAAVNSQPYSIALLGGQTVAFTLVCLAGAYAGLRRERPAEAGIWLGLLSYKPQMTAVLLLLLVYRRQWRVLAIAGLTIVVLTVLGMAVAGVDWPLKFWTLTTSNYYRDNAQWTDGLVSISLPGLIAHLAGGNGLWSTATAAVLCLGIVAALLWLWRDADPAADRFPLQFAAAVAVTLLISPHALFYEAGLLVLPVILLFDRWNQAGQSPGRRLLLAGLIGLGFLWPLAPTLGVEPLALLPIVVSALIAYELVAGFDGRRPDSLSPRAS